MSADDIRRDLNAARIEARRLASEQQAWRAHVSELFERGREAGLSTEELVEALGLAGKWTEHQANRAALKARIVSNPWPFLFGEPPAF
jgi:hypothetical protein